MARIPPPPPPPRLNLNGSRKGEQNVFLVCIQEQPKCDVTRITKTFRRCVTLNLIEVRVRWSNVIDNSWLLSVRSLEYDQYSQKVGMSGWIAVATANKCVILLGVIQN